MSRYNNRSDECQCFEARVEHSTPKALLVEMTLGGKYWMPRSVILEQGQADENGNIEFCVKGWWWDKKEPIDE